ncbi:N-acetylmannosamine-6-phosphate 2-epimerase [Paenibacillus alvei]|uniref:Putative N-acetylmannosamine-6-phosphate 2-epimerase n=2 Tax=Paenibacillus alvei TaxID=44250 RepID=A0ABT4EFF7_PAEAL|nr:N-acetylmannosamine-6-phosphate 2-epimerase [Paenibacillus alvei]MCY9532484.1 N-acetylmannosamine-6-phosphate 2-epimerase [Paenibacillus alvei]
MWSKYWMIISNLWELETMKVEETNKRAEKLAEQLQGNLIVSCQAYPGEALYGSDMMVRMALAAVNGGAAGIRSNSPQDVAAIKEAIRIPVIGIWKKEYPGSNVYITPTLADVEVMIAAGADMVALDATMQPRPSGETLEYIVNVIKTKYDIPLMADISTYEEGIRAAELGFDFISTTLSGYTPYSVQQKEPDMELIKRLAAAVSTPIIAEGRIHTPEQAEEALRNGAFSVVVGTAITRPHTLTSSFVSKIKGGQVPVQAAMSGSVIPVIAQNQDGNEPASMGEALS